MSITVKKDFNGKEVAFRKSEDGGLWLTAAEIGKALGYAQPSDAVAQIVRQHRDEFTNDITETIVSIVSGNLQTKTRYFNLEGIALICMFSEQPIAKKFRKWVRRVAKEVLTTGSYTEERLLPALSSQYGEIAGLVTTIATAVLDQVLPVIIERTSPGRLTERIHEHYDYPLSIGYEKSHWIVANEWARLHFNVPKRFNQGGHFNSYCMKRYQRLNGETPRMRKPGLINHHHDGEATYPVGKLTDIFLRQCYFDWVRMHHPKQIPLQFD